MIEDGRIPPSVYGNCKLLCKTMDQLCMSNGEVSSNNTDANEEDLDSSDSESLHESNDELADTADEGDEELDLEEQRDKIFEDMLLTFNMDNQDPLGFVKCQC